ncbi:MAG: hypothetical protein WCG80_17980 [Spirochaetales bacterium]
MGTPRIVPLGWLTVILVAGLVSLPAEEAATGAKASDGIESHVDWTEGRFYLTLTAPLVAQTDVAQMAGPKRRYLTEQLLASRLEAAFVREAAKLPVDSSRTLGDLAQEDPAIVGQLSGLVPRLKFHYSRVDEAYTSLEMRWSASLWTDFEPLLEASETPNDLSRLVSWNPSRDFSGLVIFAMGNLPWWGTNKLFAEWKPSLSFRLLSPDGEVLFDRSMAHSAALEEWGQAGLSEGKFNEEAWRERIGLDPFRIVARGVFGTNPCDLILAQEDWNRLLARPANRELLAAGKVLVLWGPFPDYTRHPNPDSVINEAEPSFQIIPQPPIEKAAEPAKSGE